MGTQNDLLKWDKRFLALAQHVAGWSKDPSTQTGAVLVDARKRVVGLGYNGFPRGVKDLVERYENRELKYRMAVHAEQNALLNALGEPRGGTVYVWPWGPCAGCAASLIQAGVSRVVHPAVIPADKAERWKTDFEIAALMFGEALVDVDPVDYP